MASLIKRGQLYYLQYSVGGKVRRRIWAGTDSFQLVKEKKRKLDSAQLSGDDNPLPIRTPLFGVDGALSSRAAPHEQKLPLNRSCQSFFQMRSTSLADWNV